MSTAVSDIPTLQAAILRILKSHESLETLGREKQVIANQLREQLNQTLMELERLKGALDYSGGVVLKDLRDELEKAKAAKAAAELAASTVPPQS